ncbi:hypothetical protein BC938DRAFT_477818 [Jimgerdemannia flammicorona]|uniref:Uncharacterized protein n=1 Tax=Jimgerdemannia flammicorona TaxID=994334 RepID=A0A433QYR9_9FUNG|nr:hypothetical protein BC938DRAFT_477818 [Jimgerdemannia flammicorona]
MTVGCVFGKGNLANGNLANGNLAIGNLANGNLANLQGACHHKRTIEWFYFVHNSLIPLYLISHFHIADTQLTMLDISGRSIFAKQSTPHDWQCDATVPHAILSLHVFDRQLHAKPSAFYAARYRDGVGHASDGGVAKGISGGKMATVGPLPSFLSAR